MCGVNVTACDALFLTVVYGWCRVGRVAVAVWNVDNVSSSGRGDLGNGSWPRVRVCIRVHCCSMCGR